MKYKFYTKIILIVIAVGIGTSSCVQSKRITKGNVFYKLDKVGGQDILRRFVVNKGFKGTIIENGGYVTVEPDDSAVVNDNSSTTEVNSSQISIAGPVINTDAIIQASQEYYFKKTKFDNTQRKRNRFVYLDSKFMLQSLSIPLKIRPALTGTLNTDFPQQVETDFNFGLAAGWKFSKNVFRSEPSTFGLAINRYSIAPGLLFNFGSTTLDDSNTRPAFTVNRNALTFSTGLVLMVGFNSFNFGIARGVDYVYGNGKADWVYQGKGWTGIIVALDLLK